jgi:uncharacterized protein YbaP (TraB family)
MHVRDAKAYTRLADMHAVIDRCELFATEFNMDEAQYSAEANHMDLPEGTTIKSLLGKKKYAKVRKIIRKSYGLDLDFFKECLPLLVNNLLTEKILSDDMQSPLDHTLWAYAKEQGKITVGVETFQEQMDILDHIPLDNQIKQLKGIAKNPEAFRREIMKAAELYEQEDIQKLYKLVKKSTGELRKLMLYDRNVIMAERIARMAAENSGCFAVGAGHLAGQKGVIKLLKAEEFQVKPFKKSVEV